MSKPTYETYTDAQLVDKIKADDQAAFQYIFKRYYQELCNFALSYLKVEITSEEVVQEMFISIWEKRQKLKIQSSFKAYLFVSVKNRSLNYLNSKTAQVSKKSHSTSSENPIQISDDSPDDNMKDAELQALVSKAIQSLPARCQEIFKLNRIEGLSYQQVADHLNLSKKTIEAQMGIAFKKLREYIKQHREFILIFLLQIWS